MDFLGLLPRSLDPDIIKVSNLPQGHGYGHLGLVFSLGIIRLEPSIGYTECCDSRSNGEVALILTFVRKV